MSPAHIFAGFFFFRTWSFWPKGFLVFHGNRWSNSSTSRSWRGWTANSRHRHEQQMRQQWQQERKFPNYWQGEKGSSCWIFLNGRLCRGQLITKNRLELPVVSDRLELKLPSGFNLICLNKLQYMHQTLFYFRSGDFSTYDLWLHLTGSSWKMAPSKWSYLRTDPDRWITLNLPWWDRISESYQ